MPRSTLTIELLLSFLTRSKVMFKAMQQRLLPYLEQEMTDVKAEFGKGRGTLDQIANVGC